jgi:membrane protein required for colicin V production
MSIDVFIVIALGIAVFKGYTKGLIVAVFSAVALFVGIAAALKLSSVVANKLAATGKVGAQWLPALSFAIVFIAAVFLVRLGAKLVEKAFAAAMLGWLNKIGGIVLFVLLYAIIISVVLFYTEKMGLLQTQTIQNNAIANQLKPFAPAIIDGVGIIIPPLKNMFTEISMFFEKIAQKA